MAAISPAMMRAILLAAALLPLASLAGCTGSGETGTFTLHATDAPDNIGDFSFLNVTVDSIALTSKDGEKHDYNASAETFDLTKLTSGNTTTLFSDDVPVGNYTRLDLHISNATGTLAADHSTVSVKAPSGRLFLNTAFEIDAGKETVFLFDIQVNKLGNGDYQFTPNADGSGTNKGKSE